MLLRKCVRFRSGLALTTLPPMSYDAAMLLPYDGSVMMPFSTGAGGLYECSRSDEQTTLKELSAMAAPAQRHNHVQSTSRAW